MWSNDFHAMDRLSHDLNLALEESSCHRQGRRKLGLRRRTRSAGNLPTCIATVVEDGSSSSPSHPPIITQPLSDSDDPQQVGLKCRMSACALESDSLNETVSPSRPTARRKRKYKKMAVDYDRPNSPVHLYVVDIAAPALVIPNHQSLSPLNLINKKKRLFKQERPITYCGKRKWSHRDRECGEMRERSFSGGCASKSYFFGKNYNEFKNGKKFGVEKLTKFKEKPLHPAKLITKNIDPAKLSPATFQPTLPGSSSFNFVYRNPKTNLAEPTLKITGFKVTTDLPPIFNAIPPSKPEPSTSIAHGKHKRKIKNKGKGKGKSSALRNPLEEVGMDCSMENDVGSSSISSSDSDSVVTCDSDREGDDELTDWPGSEELSVFNKTLNLRTTRTPSNGLTKSLNVQKPSKKEKYLPKHGLSSCKNKLDKIKSLELESCSQVMEDDTMMSDSAVEVKDRFTSFGDVKNAGLLGANANKAFFNSFQAYQEKSDVNDTTQSSFSLQKTSSSDLNLSEKSPQSDHYYSEHSVSNAALPEIREIRAGCRRVRDERPSLLILSAANEQLSKFLQDSQQLELRLPCFQNDIEERENLESLAKLYSLELQMDMGRPLLRKTSNTTQAVRVEQSRMHHNHLFSDYKRRCYGDPLGVQTNSLASNDDTSPNSDGLRTSENEFTSSLVSKSLLDPGEID